MKKVLALEGVSNSGKTSTLRIVYKKLMANADQVLSEFNIDKSRAKDIRAIFIINGIKIGLESQGDPNSRLFESLNIFKEQKCNYIICPCRTRGMTKKWINDLAPEYKCEFIKAISNKDSFTQENEKTAKYIIDKVYTDIMS